MSGKGRGHHKKHHGGGGGILGALKLARDITHIVTGPTHHHHTTHHYHAPAPKVVYVTKTVYVKEKEEWIYNRYLLKCNFLLNAKKKETVK